MARTWSWVIFLLMPALLMRAAVVTLPDAFGHPDELAVQVRARGVDVRCYHPALDMVGHPAVGCPLRFSEIE